MATLLLDNGGDSIKAMYIPSAASSASSARASVRPRFLIVPNCVGYSSVGGDNIIGAHINELPHFHGFIVRRPVADGFVADAGRQAQVWEYILQHFHIGPDDETRTRLWLTAPHGAPAEVARAVLDLAAKRFRFHSMVFVSSAFLALVASERATGERCSASHEVVAGAEGGKASDGAARRKRGRNANEAAAAPPHPEKQQHQVAPSSSSSAAFIKGTGIVIDIGFSGTTVMPYLDYAPVTSSAVYTDVGGKLLTNRLKEHLSFTQMNLTEDGWLVSRIKERCCEVAATAVSNATTVVSGAGKSRRVQAAAAAAAAKKYYLPTIPALYPLGCLEEELDARLGSGKERRQRHKTRARAAITTYDNISGEEDDDDDDDDSSVSEGEGRVDRKVLPLLRLQPQECRYIPGLLFSPPDLGVHQLGLVACVLHSLGGKGFLAQAQLLRLAALRGGVHVYGGSCQFPHLLDRLESELAAALPAAIGGGWPAPVVHRPAVPEGVAVAGEGVGTVAAGAAAMMPLYGAAWLLGHGGDAAAACLRARAEGRSLCYLRGPHSADLSNVHEAMLQML